MSVSSSTAAAVLIAISCLSGLTARTDAAQYLGKFLGKLTELHHGVSGEVYAVDSRTLHIKDFTYDGQGPAAYFFAGNSRTPANTGFRIRDENGSPDVLRRYRKEGVTITLPEGKTLSSIKWFSVWCEEFEVNFGDVKIPRNFEYPRPQKIDALRGVHGVASSSIVIVDAQTLLVPDLSYDGEAPDAKFWVGRGSKPTPQGTRVPDENGKEVPLRRYDRKTVVLTLPGDLTVFDIGHFGIWCEAFTVDFGHVQIPQGLNIPPSLKMLGVSPQSKLNCEVLHDDLAFEVRWAIAGESIVLQLVAKLENREYMSFGVSGDEENSVMIGGDVVVAWVDKETLKGFAEDYFLDDKSQCSGPKGSCPDNRLAESTNNIRLLNAAMVNGYSIVTYQRPLRPSDAFDKQILTNKTQPIIWAIGPLNQRDEVSFHSQYTKHNQFIDFGRSAKWNCPMPEGDQPPMKPVTVAPALAEAEEIVETEPPKQTTTTARTRNNERRRGSSANRQQAEASNDSEKSASRTRASERRGSTRTTSRPVPTPAPVKNRNAWDIPPIQCDEPDDGVFYAQMGPTGGKRGYPAITGHVGWGISWYINGLLIPEINVVRGKTYTFVVEGGFDPETPAKYHPFYITDDEIGGYEHKTDDEKQNVRIFAGVRQTKDGELHPTGVGRLCHWTHQGESEADDFESFGAYQRTLELKCDQGEPGVIQWTPDKNTPDTVYYQCFTHRYLGWKINVLDSCDRVAAASEIEEVRVPAEDLEDSPSIRVETRVKPNDIEVIQEKNNKESNEKQSQNTFTYLDLDDMKMPPVIFQQELPNIENSNVFKTDVQISRENATQKHQHNAGKIILRRPVPIHIRPPFMVKPQRTNSMHRHPPPMIMKKPYYRPMLKMPMRPVKYEKPMMMPPRPNVMIMKPPSNNQPNLLLMPAVKILPEPSVEISPLQPSTEREPLVQTEKLTTVAPKDQQYEAYENMKPAVNTGFNPASVVIESGFKPIIHKEIEHRMAVDDEEEGDVGPEVEFESEVGMIDETKEHKESTHKATEYFEPMFIPSPTIDVQLKKTQSKQSKSKKGAVIVVTKQSRSADDEMVSANERVESYYLPPDNNKSKPVERPKHRSNIDVAPSTLVTFDGKKVSGASLTARGQDKISFEPRSSKASEFIRRTPQFLPFKGELPPLDSKYVNFNAPQLQSKGVLSRELNAPDVTSTKLAAIRHFETSEVEELLSKERRKRAAHHTEEHTAQQKKEQEEYVKSSSVVVQTSPLILLVSCLLRVILKL